MICRLYFPYFLRAVVLFMPLCATWWPTVAWGFGWGWSGRCLPRRNTEDTKGGCEIGLGHEVRRGHQHCLRLAGQMISVELNLGGCGVGKSAALPSALTSPSHVASLDEKLIFKLRYADDW